MVVCRKSWLIFLENIILCTDKQPRLQGTKRSRHTSTISSLAAGEFAISIQARRIISHVLLLSDITIVTVVLWYCCVVEGGPSDYVSSSVLGWEESRTGRTERVRRRRGGRGGGGMGMGASSSVKMSCARRAWRRRSGSGSWRGRVWAWLRDWGWEWDWE